MHERTRERMCSSDTGQRQERLIADALSRRILMSAFCIRIANARDVEGESPRARETPFIRTCVATRLAQLNARCDAGIWRMVPRSL